MNSQTQLKLRLISCPLQKTYMMQKRQEVKNKTWSVF